MSYGLPPLLEEIAGVAGLDAALALAEARGGQKVYFPSTLTLGGDHWLVGLVGMDAAQKICALHGVRNVEIPRGPTSDVHRRRTRIAAMIAQGYSNNEIARACGVSFRAVTHHRAKARAAGDANQLKLF